MSDRPETTDEAQHADPTLDIVRRVMAEAEHMPGPEREPAPDPEPPAPSRRRGLDRLTRRRADGRRVPRWGLIGLAMVATGAWLAPWAALALAILVVCLPVIAWLTLGPDRIAEMAVGAHDRLARRNPAKAAGLRRRWRRLRDRLARIAARLPGGLGDALVPEPIPNELRQRLEADPFGRLEGERGPG